MKQKETNRRKFLKHSVTLSVGGLVVAQTRPALSVVNMDHGDYEYEVTHTEEEWKELLSPDAYRILRLGDTEFPQSSDLWDDYRDGNFACGGCQLPIYESTWRVELKKGWVFFSQSVPNAVMMGIDGEPPNGMVESGLPAAIEAHCRRCGSHLGHIVKVDKQIVHCINGVALEFTPS